MSPLTYLWLVGFIFAKIQGIDPPTAQATCIFKTSSTLYAGTSDTMYASFLGSIASSGVHSLGSFDDGMRVTRTINLDRAIGTLSEIVLYTNSTDGWLPAELSCEIDGYIYVMNCPRQWLDTFDTELFALYGDGHEPFAQEDAKALPSSSTIRLQVFNSWMSLNSKLGVEKPYLSV